MIKYMCAEKGCNGEISYSNFMKHKKLGTIAMCKSCFMKNLCKNPKNHPNFKNGITVNKNYCIDCKIHARLRQ